MPEQNICLWKHSTREINGELKPPDEILVGRFFDGSTNAEGCRSLLPRLIFYRTPHRFEADCHKGVSKHVVRLLRVGYQETTLFRRRNQTMLLTRFSPYKIVAVLGVALSILSLQGCGGSHNNQTPSRSRLAGEYSYGFETSAFRPCGTNNRYWVTDGTQTIQDAVPGEYSAQTITTVYVDLEGTVGPSGSFGNLGLYEHELSVQRVFSGSTTTPDACR